MLLTQRIWGLGRLRGGREVEAPVAGSLSSVATVTAAAAARTEGRVAASRVSPPNPPCQDTCYGLAGALDCRVVSNLCSVRAKNREEKALARKRPGYGYFRDAPRVHSYN